MRYDDLFSCSRIQHQSFLPTYDRTQFTVLGLLIIYTLAFNFYKISSKEHRAQISISMNKR